MPKKKESKTKRDDFKRPNGYGTCYRLSGNRRRPWVARVTAGWAHDGRQLYQVIGYFGDEKQCRDALELHRFQPVAPKVDITWGQLYEEWSEVKYRHIGESTASCYRAAWKYLNRFKGVRVRDIRTGHLQSVIDGCFTAKMSRSTLDKMLTVSVLMLNYAVQNDIVSKNYAEYITMPKAEKTEKQRFTDIEVKRLLDAAPNNEWVGTVLILIYTGTRISEMLRLTRFNVDLEAGIIRGGIKTDAGKNRIIPIHPKIFEYVAHWYHKNGDALICREDGRKFLPQRYREHYYYPALEAAKVSRLSPHACRHTFCTLMAEAGVDTSLIQRLAGHANYATTANTYTHPDLASLKGAIGKL